MSSLANYFHTVRYLRPVQVLGRIRFKLWRPTPDQRPAPALHAPIHPYSTAVFAAASMLGPDRFRFLNLEGSCSDAAQWMGDGRSQLWTYNLHYFEDLNAKDASSRSAWHQRLVERWVEENPPGVGVGWDPYPVSRRVVNWIKWSLGGNSLTPKVRQSLAVQVRWLMRRIESHLQGNHVFANAKALIHAGLYFEGEEADRWLLRGLTLMQAQIGEQVLSDGGHFERSTMYHAGFVEDLLDTISVMQAFGRTMDPSWHATVAHMMSWLEAMTHPDGDIAFFNDAAFGICQTPAALRGYAIRLNISLEEFGHAGVRLLMPSGYVSIDSPPFFLVCDVAPIGPDHLPGHAHADTLSFEMSFKGRRVFVNSGTAEYGLSAERQRQRGTAAHNTLVLDGENSSEVWAGFRVARRARARLLSATAVDSVFSVVGEHDGYRRLRGGNLHRRRWTLSARELLIEDTVEGRFGRAMCYFHLHPDIQVRRGAGLNLQLTDSGGLLLDVRFEGAAIVDVVDSTWHPEFGVALASRCIVAQLDGPRLTASIRGSELN
ncbi:MAG: hypothetical protein QOI88_2822 [Gammaproteobacteria bacterium]|nr:hypothetical protein [Gammaproteobacteria bacterium]